MIKDAAGHPYLGDLWRLPHRTRRSPFIGSAPARAADPTVERFISSSTRKPSLMATWMYPTSPSMTWPWISSVSNHSSCRTLSAAFRPAVLMASSMLVVLLPTTSLIRYVVTHWRLLSRGCRWAVAVRYDGVTASPGRIPFGGGLSRADRRSSVGSTSEPAERVDAGGQRHGWPAATRTDQSHQMVSHGSRLASR